MDQKKKTQVIISSILLLAITVTGFVAFTDRHYARKAQLAIDVGTNSFHVTVYLQRVGEEKQYWDHHAGTLTTIGKNFIEDQLGDSPAADPAKWITLSLNGGAPAAGWTEIPAEIAAGGLSRTAGTYASTGDGVWTITNEFTASAGHVDVQLTGLQWVNAGDGNLLAADTFAAVTLANGDKLTVTWTTTVT